MAHIPKSVARRVIYWNFAAAMMIVAMAVAVQVRRSHGYDRIIVEAGRKHGVDPALVAAVIWQESNFDPTAYGKAGEVGLMQITPGAATDWARRQGTDAMAPDQLWDPHTNILVGTWYLGRAIAFWQEAGLGDALPAALAEYNAGHENAERWVHAAGSSPKDFVDAITFPTTRKYIEDVLARYEGGT